MCAGLQTILHILLHSRLETETNNKRGRFEILAPNLGQIEILAVWSAVFTYSKMPEIQREECVIYVFKVSNHKENYFLSQI